MQLTSATVAAGFVIACFGTLPVQALENTEAVRRNWPQWRGPLATGVAPHAVPPLEWSESKNVRWRVALPGYGTSTPVVWENQVWILTAIPATGPNADGGETIQEFTLLSFDRRTGQLLWKHSPRKQVPHEGHHQDHGYASASPITDGEHLIAHFGSFGTYAYDLRGNPLWETDLGDMQTRNGFGEGSSPALHGDTVVILWDHEGADSIIALDKRSGQKRWSQSRDEPTGWSSPVIVEHSGRTQVIVNGTKKVRAYDLADGTLLWECGGQTANAIPSPVCGPDMVYVTSGFRGHALQAIGLGHAGDLTGTSAVRWSFNRYTPYVPSPLLDDNLLYLTADNSATLSVFDAHTGERYLEAERLEGLRGIYASPVAANGRVIIVGRDGGALVLERGPRLNVLATNRLDDNFDASPALVGGEMFLRGRQHLYCLAED